VYVSGHLGGASAALRLGFVDHALNERFYRPLARVDLAEGLRACASAAIDISDGLLQDLGHLARASYCRIDIVAARVPLFPGADLADALYGGDDYELCFTSSSQPSFPAVEIGLVSDGSGVWVDGQMPARSGYQHFG